jgi:hypothetical protein
MIATTADRSCAGVLHSPATGIGAGEARPCTDVIGQSMTPTPGPPDTPRGDDEVGPRARALLAAAKRLHDAVQPDIPPMMVFPVQPDEDDA